VGCGTIGDSQMDGGVNKVRVFQLANGQQGLKDFCPISEDNKHSWVCLGNDKICSICGLNVHDDKVFVRNFSTGEKIEPNCKNQAHKWELLFESVFKCQYCKLKRMVKTSCNEVLLLTLREDDGNKN
jgi:hypothetical protein